MHNFDIVASIGTYDKDGTKKYINRNVGKVVVSKDGRTSLKIDASFNPAGCIRSEDGGVWLSLFEPKAKSDTPAAAATPKPAAPAFDDEIPF